MPIPISSVPPGGFVPETQNAPGSAPISGYGDYDQMFAANPYRKQTYNQTWWQKLASSLGFRTGYDNWLDQTSTQIAEYDAGIFSQMFQNEYNSESAKAARMRAAGENPDLLGTGDVSDAAAPAEDANGMVPDAESGNATKVAGLIGSFASSLLAAFNTGVGIYKSLAQVKEIQAGINSLAISNADKVVDVVDKIIVGSVPLSVIEKGDNIDEYLGTIDMSKYGFTGSGLDAANEALKDRFDSIKNNAEIRKNVYERYANISNTYQEASKGFIPEVQMPSSPDEMFNLQTACMARAAKRILEYKQANEEFKEGFVDPTNLGNELSEGQLGQQELGELVGEDYGTAVAQNKMTGIESDTFLKTAQRIINEERANMYAALRIKADSGDSLAAACLHAMVLQDLMQVDFGAEVDFSTLKTFSAAAEGLFSFSKFGPKGELSARGAFEKQLGKHLKLHVGVKSK